MIRRLLLLLAIICSSSLPSLSQCTKACQAAFDLVVRHEDKTLSGTVSREPFGGVARFGVNSIAHPEAVRNGFYTMPKTRAIRYARSVFYWYYWRPMRLDCVYNTKLSTRLADLAFNLGPVRATVLVQKALNMQGAGLSCKGRFDLDTLNDVNEFPTPATYVLLKIQAIQFYTRLSKRKGPVARKWRSRWLGRLNEE